MNNSPGRICENFSRLGLGRPLWSSPKDTSAPTLQPATENCIIKSQILKPITRCFRCMCLKSMKQKKPDLLSWSWMYFPKRLLLLLRNVHALPEEEKNKGFRKRVMEILLKILLQWWFCLWISYQKPPWQGWSPVLVFLFSLQCPGTSEKRWPQWHNISLDSATSMSGEIFCTENMV